MSHAGAAVTIFLTVALLAATNTVPIVIAALTGATAMVAFKVLDVRAAVRSIDPLIVATIGTALAMGIAMQETGGARFLAHLLVSALEGASPAIILSLFFLLVAVMSNIVSSKAAAVLFTPIAIDLAQQIGVPPAAFAVAVVFAANFSFASPLAYQTNLVVMGPGDYRFLDFTRVGAPLIIFLWLVFSFVAPWYYGL